MTTTSAKLATKPLAKELNRALSSLQETPNLASQNFNQAPLLKIEDHSMPDQGMIAQWRERAKMVDANAQYNLGVAYLNGEDVPKDAKEAIKWFRQAAEHGNAEAQYNLGVICFSGMGTRQNYEEAAKWFSDAAQQGLVLAKFNLAQAYRAGNGVPQSDERALELFEEILKSKRFIERTNQLTIPLDPDASLVLAIREAIQAIKLKAANRSLEDILNLFKLVSHSGQ